VLFHQIFIVHPTPIHGQSVEIPKYQKEGAPKKKPPGGYEYFLGENNV